VIGEVIKQLSNKMMFNFAKKMQNQTMTIELNLLAGYN